jgi:hypothetical protein
MAAQGWKARVAMGLLGIAGLMAGCTERQDREVREDAREVGRQVGDTARDVGDATREAVEGFKEGVGGSGTEQGDDAHIGDKKGVIDDGEGPFEQPTQPGEKKTLLNDGKGPLEQK